MRNFPHFAEIFAPYLAPKAIMESIYGFAKCQNSLRERAVERK